MANFITLAQPRLRLLGAELAGLAEELIGPEGDLAHGLHEAEAQDRRAFVPSAV